MTGADVLPWAFAIARRLAIDSYRRQKREVLEGDLDLSPVLSDLAPEDALRTKRAAEVVQETLGNLPDS
ncbi:MAG TPA: hypothetical protein VGH28_23110 [Polyangiaceae bacterium]